MTWRLMKGKRETPCCGQRVRVQVIEPGPQYRRCGVCRKVSVFVLEPMSSVPHTLRMRWVAPEELPTDDPQPVD